MKLTMRHGEGVYIPILFLLQRHIVGYHGFAVILIRELNNFHMKNNYEDTSYTRKVIYRCRELSNLRQMTLYAKCLFVDGAGQGA
jgi:hypothetical protein